jgi:hypothetical protein
VELFFDLVYVLAVTQLSHLLLEHLDARGAAQTALLLVAVWIAWVYSAWFTNWFDPDRRPVRLVLLGVMLASLRGGGGVGHPHGAGAVAGLTSTRFTWWAPPPPPRRWERAAPARVGGR